MCVWQYFYIKIVLMIGKCLLWLTWSFLMTVIRVLQSKNKFQYCYGGIESKTFLKINSFLTWKSLRGNIIFPKYNSSFSRPIVSRHSHASEHFVRHLHVLDAGLVTVWYWREFAWFTRTCRYIRVWNGDTYIVEIILLTSYNMLYCLKIVENLMDVPLFAAIKLDVLSLELYDGWRLFFI